MSLQITEAFVQQFSDNVVMQAQQKGTRLRGAVRTETIHGKSKAFDRIGQVEMVEKVSRHSNTPQLDTPHSRRWCYLKDWEWSDLIDDLDKVRVLNEPTSEYVMAAMWAAGRKMDDYIIAAADMTVVTGEDATGTPATLPNSQMYAANDGTNFTDLNIRTLRAIKRKFDANDVDESIPRHIACTSNQIYSLLGETQITSADYANVKALVDGKVDTFMGFKFHRLERLTKQVSALSASTTTGAVGSGTTVVGHRKVVAWAQDGIILGIGSDVKSRITERSDKGYATQPYINMAIGSTRMEEEKVFIALCKES